MTRWYTCEELVELATPYVLGILDPEDEEAVAAGLSACPEAMAEVERLGGVVPYLADALDPVEPSAAVKGRLLAAASADLDARRAAAASAAAVASAAPPTPAAEPAAPKRVVELIPEDHPEAGYRVISPTPPARVRRTARGGWLAWGLAAAAVLLIAVLGAWNLSLRGQLDQAQAYATAVKSVVDTAAQPGSLVAVLGSETAGGPRGIAALATDGQVVLAVRGLTPTTGTQVYEAWLIGSNKKPVAIGDFSVASDGVGYLPDGQGPTATGVVVALTLEPGPGATKPTLPVVSSGVARSGPKDA